MELGIRLLGVRRFVWRSISRRIRWGLLTEAGGGGEDGDGVEWVLEVEERRRARGEKKRNTNPGSPHNITTMLIIQKFSPIPATHGRLCEL